jgi:hypothetical protein
VGPRTKLQKSVSLCPARRSDLQEATSDQALWGRVKGRRKGLQSGPVLLLTPNFQVKPASRDSSVRVLRLYFGLPPEKVGASKRPISDLACDHVVCARHSSTLEQQITTIFLRRRFLIIESHFDFRSDICSSA